MMSIRDSVPEIETHIVDSLEIPQSPLVPAVTNALKRTGGKRLRAHPLILG